MIDPHTGQMIPNVKCPTCRMRHPAEWTCAYSRAATVLLKSAITKPPKTPLRELLREARDMLNDLNSAYGAKNVSDLVARIDKEIYR